MDCSYIHKIKVLLLTSHAYVSVRILIYTVASCYGKYRGYYYINTYLFISMAVNKKKIYSKVYCAKNIYDPSILSWENINCLVLQSLRF